MYLLIRNVLCEGNFDAIYILVVFPRWLDLKINFLITRSELSEQHSPVSATSFTFSSQKRLPFLPGPPLRGADVYMCNVQLY